MEQVIDIEAYNQFDIVDLTVYDTDPDPKLHNGYKFNERELEIFMDSVEVVAHMEIARREGMSLYKNYIQDLQGIAKLTDDYKENIENGVFSRHNFCPLLDKTDDGKSLNDMGEVKEETK